jgi:hypothetical protein
VLTNQQMGVDHSGPGAAVRPAPECEAVAGLTDHRVVFVVGGPVESDRDFVRSLWHSEISETSVETEALTTRWAFETTAGRRWSFTARETGTDEVAAFLANAQRSADGPHPVVRPLVEHCTALTVHLERENWTAFDQRRETAWAALEQARADCPNSRAGGVPDAVDRLGHELHRLARDRHLRDGRATLSAAEAHLDDGALAASFRRARAAVDLFEQARTVSEDGGIECGDAVSRLEAAADTAETSLGRLLATAKMHRTEAADLSDAERRVTSLETALERYNTVAALVSDNSVSEGVRERARADAERAIGALVEARLDAAATHGDTGNRTLADGNRQAAERAYLAALEDVDRALELAASFPPGDPQKIRTRREALTAQVASLTAGG